MADIDVVKKSSHTWLWIVIALVVVAALFFMLRGNQRPNTRSLMNEGGQPLAAALSARSASPRG
jgi:bacteriorhodopsin